MAKEREKQNITPASTGKIEMPNKPQAIEQVPDYINTGQGRGTEEAEFSDLVLPRIAIAQTNTPQAKRADPTYIPGLVEGQLFNTVTYQIYGTELVLVPLFFFKQRIKWAGKYGSGKGIDCQSLNGKDGGRLHPEGCGTCIHSQFKPEDEEDNRPDCNAFFNFMSLLQDRKWAVLSLKSTNIQVARQFLANVRLSGYDMFARTLKVSTISKVKKNNSYYGAVLTPGPFVPRELYVAAEAEFKKLKDRGIQMDTRGLQEEEGDTDFGPEQRGGM